MLNLGTLMQLNDSKIKGLKYTGKEKLYSDGRGSMLYLRVREVSKSFLFKYKLSGKTYKLSLGTYPDLSLKKAREKAAEYRELLSNGVDPKTYKDKQKAEHDKTLEHIAAYWLDVKKNEFSASRNSPCHLVFLVL